MVSRRKDKRTAYRVAVVGATGAVGREVVRLLARDSIPLANLALFASSRSLGKRITFKNREIPVEDLANVDFTQFDIAIFATEKDQSVEYATKAVAAGCVVVDNSSAFRMYDDVPLVVPEINAKALRRHKGIIANPNCTSAIALMALKPLHDAFGLVGFDAASYQAASGAGTPGIEELHHQLDDFMGAKLLGQVWSPREHATGVFPEVLFMNCIPQVGPLSPGGSTTEEAKLFDEGRKILDLPDLLVDSTCVRISVMRCHSIAITAAFSKKVSIRKAHEALSRMPGLRLRDSPGTYPTALEFEGEQDCGVGRIREGTVFPNTLKMWVVGDQLLKGAAWNAVQIVEALVAQNLVRVLKK